MTTDMAPFTADQQAVARYLGLNPSDPKSHAAMAVCDRYKLDPILKHVIVLPKGGVYVTRDGLLHVAHMSGQLDGIVLEEQGETEAEWWAEVSVYRKDMRFPFKFRGRYSKSAGNKAYGPEMALKCAEALALRRAFDISGLPVLEERDAAPQQVVNTARLTPKPVPKVALERGETVEGIVEEVDTETGEIVDDEQAPEPELFDAEIVEDEPEETITAAQSRKLFASLRALDIADKEHGLAMIRDVVGHDLESTKLLTKAEASMVIDTLDKMAQG